MKIDRFYIDRQINLDDEVRYLISKIGHDPEPVKDSAIVYDYINRAEDPVTRAKHTLYITENKGAVVRECPGTSEYTCCDYTILHTGTFCTMDCSYCILQAYFHPPVLQYFAGYNQIENSLEEVFREDKIYRIGTGEFTDSLIWEKISTMPAKLVETFSRQDHSILELKTKTVNIDSLLSLGHNKKTILSWSVNTPAVIRSEERGTTSLSARLDAARRAQDAGYEIALHFDPLVIYPGCEEEYENTVQTIFNHVDPTRIVWISIGSFRFMPALKPIIESRFKNSVICYGEFICGLDNKMRYFKPLRMKLYKKIISCIRDYSPDVVIYFCMEDKQVWEQCLDFFPGREGELGHLLDKSAAMHCGLNKRLF